MKKVDDELVSFEKVDMVTSICQRLLHICDETLEPVNELVLGQGASVHQGENHFNILDLVQDRPEGLVGFPCQLLSAVFIN